MRIQVKQIKVYGEPIEVHDKQGGWYEITCSHNYDTQAEEITDYFGNFAGYSHRCVGCGEEVDRGY